MKLHKMLPAKPKSRSTKKWRCKVEILRNTAPKQRRQRALKQMQMTGYEWVQAASEIGVYKPDDVQSRPYERMNPPLGVGGM